VIPEIGQMALALSLGLAAVLAVVALWGAAKQQPDWMALSRPTTFALALCVVIAFACLTASFVRNDFSVLYVAQNSNSSLPLPYRIAGVWGGHEGSLLLWMLMLVLWMVAVALFSKNLPNPMVARILGVMGLVSVGFLLFMLTTSNPFDRLLPAALDGRDLNPLLQDPGMVFHPPMLYMGYVGFSVAFAFAIAALLGGQLDAQWARWSRPWTIVAWCFLTLGIALGSGWAYYELGWGGWWFWDPVENASFMPWLVGTALMHSLAVTEKRNTFRVWTVLLAILAFSLSLLGTFLVRSGVLSSVHAFATDPRRGLFILGFLVLVIGGSLSLFAWRASKVSAGGTFALFSRETLLLTNNVFLVSAAGTVLLGTLYPLLLDALGLGKLSVGPPYFEAVFVPLMAPVLFLMSIGPLVNWKRAALPELVQRLRWAAGVSLATALAAPLLAGEGRPWSALAAFGFWLAFWVAAGVFVHAWQHLKPSRVAGRWQMGRVPRATTGMLLAHLGVAVFVLGVTMVKTYESEKDVRMELGETVSVAGFTFTFKGVSELRGPNYQAARATIGVSEGGKPLRELYPEKRIYRVQQNPMTEAAIATGLWRDLYVSLGEPVSATAWIVRVYHKPFIDWIWGGCVFMALGGFLAMSDRRYRAKARQDRNASVHPTLQGEQTT
jgi:cytochrome c-type biogenesis protein CcmF